MSVDQRRALALVWRDREAANLYRYRAPYPSTLFEALRRFIVAPPVILDAGCGTGALSRHLTTFANRIDAIDPSEAMIAEGKRLPGGDDPRIRWIVGTAEAAPLEPPYGLITCGKSLHWMEHDVVMPRFADALAPGGRLVVVDDDVEYPSLWKKDVIAIIERYSPVNPSRFKDLFGELQGRGLFERQGFLKTTVIPFEQSVEDFIRGLQSTSSLSRVTLGERTDAFAADVRALFTRLGITRLVLPVAAGLVWGRPLRP